MKNIQKILVPTDFSEGAKTAARFAIQLGNQFGSQITLGHFYQIPRSTGSFVSIRKIVEADAQSDMEKLQNELSSEVANGASLEVLVQESNTVNTIVGKAKRENYDLIVMGTKGASGLAGVILGSVAASVLERAETPLLTVPPHTTFDQLTKIALALDDKGIKEYNNFDLLHTLVSTFDSKLNVVHVDTGSGDLELASRVHYLFKEVEHTYTCILDSDDIDKSIQNFTRTQEADLLCMLRRKHSLLHRLFTSSHTKSEVTQADVPLLVLHE
jgi:nucleotide-binding universal stress UspA family protein